MSVAPLLNEQECEQLRRTKYNARVVERIDIHDELAVFRVYPEHGVTSFQHALG